MKNMLTREEYIECKKNNDQSSILTAYFEHKSQLQIGVGDFVYLMFQAIEDDPILQQKIDYQYPLIIGYFDKYFHVNFLYFGAPENQSLITFY